MYKEYINNSNVISSHLADKLVNNNTYSKQKKQKQKHNKQKKSTASKLVRSPWQGGSNLQGAPTS